MPPFGEVVSRLRRLIARCQHIDAIFFVYLEKIAKIVLFGLLGAAILTGLVFQILSIAHPYSLDYGEAPLVDQSLRLAAGDDIYRADLSIPPYTITNYPPVYVALLAPWARLFGPVFWAGRLISTLCAFASALFLALILYNLTGDKLAATMSGMIFLAIPYVVKWSTYLRIDHLALALSLAGLYLVIRQPRTRLRFLGGAYLLVAAIFTRQSYALAAPLAAFVWLLWKDWKSAFRLAAVVGGSTLVLFLLLNGLSAGGFYTHIVTANVNEFGAERLRWNLEDLRDLAPVLIVLAGISIFLWKRPPGTWRLVFPFLLGATLTAATIGKIGSNINYFLELSAALSLAAGAVVAWSRQGQGSHLLRAILLGLLIFQGAKLFEKTLNVYIPELTERKAALSQLRQLEQVVRETEGPVLADEYMGMILLAGRRLEIQPFEVTQLANAGIWDQTPLVERIQGKEYPLILIHDFGGYPVYKERWTEAMLQAIERNYRIEGELGGTRLYRPIGANRIVE